MAPAHLKVRLELEVLVTRDVVLLKVPAVVDDFRQLRHLADDCLELPLVAHLVLLAVELGEAALHHVLDAQLLDAQQVQDHRVCQAELRLQQRRFALHAE